MTPTGEEWLKTTCMTALSSLVRLQNRFFSRLAFLLGDLFKLLENCILQGTSLAYRFHSSSDASTECVACGLQTSRAWHALVSPVCSCCCKRRAHDSRAKSGTWLCPVLFDCLIRPHHWNCWLVVVTFWITKCSLTPRRVMAMYVLM